MKKQKKSYYIKNNGMYIIYKKIIIEKNTTQNFKQLILINLLNCFLKK